MRYNAHEPKTRCSFRSRDQMTFPTIIPVKATSARPTKKKPIDAHGNPDVTPTPVRQAMTATTPKTIRSTSPRKMSRKMIPCTALEVERETGFPFWSLGEPIMSSPYPELLSVIRSDKDTSNRKASPKILVPNRLPPLIRPVELRRHKG